MSVKRVDVLIIGAGINGAGLFRDLCEQGATCAIVDKADFGSGTSAAPSRLIHGGLKYLETGEFGLVAQSTLERNLLLRNAPHLVKPLPTVVPIFSWTKGIHAALKTLFGSTTAPRNRGALLIKIGLWLYDFYGARQRVMPRHAMWSRKRALAEIPPLTPRIVAAGTYYDAKIACPERLVLELVLDGLAACADSEAVNYAAFDGVAADIVSFRGPDGSLREYSPRIVVNAAGPWIDKVNSQLGIEGKLIGGTKGSHILLDHPQLLEALNGRMIYFEADDGRICLVYEYLGKALVGSTDTRADDPDTVRCEDEEIDYFLASLRSLLPGLEFSREQMVYAYSGIRPLPASDGTAAGLISRDHSSPVHEATSSRPFPVVSLVGGKWTTFRGFAEEVADLVLARLGVERKSSTQALAIGGGLNLPTDADGRRSWIAKVSLTTGVGEDRVEELLDRYGATAEQIALYEGPKSARLPNASGYSVAEIEFLIRSERVVRLDDIVMRRTALAVAGLLGRHDLGMIAEIAAKKLGWTTRQKDAEVERTLEILLNRYRLRLQPD